MRDADLPVSGARRAHAAQWRDRLRDLWPAVARDRAATGASRLSYAAEKAALRGRGFWWQVLDHALLSAVIVAIIVALAWKMGKL